MFQCKHCCHQGFDLMVSPSVRDSVVITTNEHGDVVITMGERRMVADVGFMNQFATCTGCQAKGQWEYYYGHAGEALVLEDD
ncbi:MAG: hypothetical protein QE263_02420 [Vampirovibrionales bacterium]|nr:hypothetical protein [Vampirovibrionales bacterium]